MNTARQKQAVRPNYAFIDAQNLHLGAKEAGLELDYRRFRVYLKEKYRVGKAYLFIGFMPANRDLYEDLQENGFILKFKPVIVPNDGRKPKGDVDADVAFSIMRYYKEYDKAVIVTSDGDFDTVVKYLNKKDKLAAVISPNRAKCSALLKIAAKDKMQYLEDLYGKVSKRKTVQGENEKAPPGDETQGSAFS